MKQIIMFMAILLIWAGTANAGVLKVKVPADEYEQMKSQLETLKMENSKLKQAVNDIAENPSTDNADAEELLSQLEALENENSKLKQAVGYLSEKSSINEPATTEIVTQLDALAKENNQLKQQLEATKDVNDRLNALGKENRKLKRSVASLKEKGSLQRGDRRTARQVYHDPQKTFADHIFK